MLPIAPHPLYTGPGARFYSMSRLAPLKGFYAYSEALHGIYYGAGCTSSALPKLVKQFGSKALVVTGKTLKSKARNVFTRD